MGYYLYILESEENGRYYVGISDDPERRLTHHNSTSTGFTSRYRPWQLVFSHEYPSREEAKEAERQIKDWKSRTMTEYASEGEIGLAELLEQRIGLRGSNPDGGFVTYRSISCHAHAIGAHFVWWCGKEFG